MGGLSRYKCVEKEQCAMAQLSDIPLQLWAKLSRQFQKLFVGILKNVLTANDTKTKPLQIATDAISQGFLLVEAE